MVDKFKVAAGSTIRTEVAQNREAQINEAQINEARNNRAQGKAKPSPKPSRVRDLPSTIEPADQNGFIVDGLDGAASVTADAIADVIADVEEESEANLSASRAAVAEFLARRSVTSGLSFQAAEGYWANTYLPGAPALRLLESRLRSADFEDLRSLAGGTVSLHGASALTVQPFDPPDRAALAVYVNSDLRGLQGPGRALLQIGVQASPRGAARRGSMNVCLVVDLRGELSVEESSLLRAAVTAFERSSSAGDRFQLTFAGRSFVAEDVRQTGIESSDLRHGNVRVALDQLLKADNAGQEPTLSAGGNDCGGCQSG